MIILIKIQYFSDGLNLRQFKMKIKY